MDLGLKGKRALVAASSRGLGRAIAEELAAEGCDLLICARSGGPLEATRSEIAAAHGVRVLAHTADLSKADQAGAVVRRALDELGQVDILVTNNGGPPSGPFESHDLKAWHHTYHLTLESVLVLTHGVLPGMKERRWGRILNVTSITVKQPVDGLILSNSLRAAVTGFARTLANEVAPFGVTVNNIIPGYTRTERLDELAEQASREGDVTPEEVFAKWSAQTPMDRVAEPRELAAMAAFLVSERASYVTAQSIAVDGGWIRSLF
ncbi:MAG TPA: SDR family oxidoreductase [Longimicrobiales bacterium]|nr:SDR family oxidoreductase [Longimicrobiales bacterium]